MLFPFVKTIQQQLMPVLVDSYLWSTGTTTINLANTGKYSVTVTNNYSTISCSAPRFRSPKIKHCHDNFCRYGLDGQSKYNNRLHNWRGRFWIFNWPLTFRTVIFWISSAENTRLRWEKNGLRHCNRRGLFIDVPQILYAKWRWF
jgi:hypothetical protein